MFEEYKSEPTDLKEEVVPESKVYEDLLRMIKEHSAIQKRGKLMRKTQHFNL